MAKDDESFNDEFSLEAILAEFATNHTPSEEPASKEGSDSAERPKPKGEPTTAPLREETPSAPTSRRGETPPTPPKGGEEPGKEPPIGEKMPPTPTAPKDEVQKMPDEAERPRVEVKERRVKRPKTAPQNGKKAPVKPRNWEEDTIPFPVPPPPQEPETPGWREDTIPFPLRPRQDAAPTGKKPHREEDDPDATKVLEFVPKGGKPSDDAALEERSPLAAGLDRLKKKADEFAGHMYEEEGVEDDERLRKAEKLIPGVDEEEGSPPPRPPKRLKRPAPDLHPGELAKRYDRGLKSLRFRRDVVLFLFVLAFYLTLAEHLPLPIPTPLARNAAWRCYALAALQGGAMLLGADAVLLGLVRPFQFRAGMDTMIALSNIAVLADALTIPGLTGGMGRQPYCAIAILGLGLTLTGQQLKRRGQRLACKTAASASQPYRVTRDAGAWNGKDTYAKWSGALTGFGSQMQGADGAERIFSAFVPLLMGLCAVFAVISSLGRGRPQDLLWSLAAIFTAGASFSATLCFGRPWQRLCARLFKSGAALAGWEGVTNTTGASNILLYDADLFPPGAVKFNGIKIMEGFAADKVISCTATVIRDGGSELEKVFHDLLRSQGTIYRKGEGDLTPYEGGGLSETIRDELILVGSWSFMELMKVSLPAGLNVKNAVFCAIDGELAGIFALNYHLPQAVPQALDSLIRNHITPVLCTRDFNIIPSMLRSRFKLPVDKLEFPSIERRRELSDAGLEHDPTLAAVLCREGVAPYAEAVVGGKRLRAAVRLSAVLACAGSAVGALLGFYLTFVAAYESLTPTSLLVFLLMWLVPTFLISGWVDRY